MRGWQSVRPLLVGKMLEDPLILMYAHDIKPVLLLCAWLKEFDFTVAERPEKTFISDIAHTIQSQLCLAFLQ